MTRQYIHSHLCTYYAECPRLIKSTPDSQFPAGPNNLSMYDNYVRNMKTTQGLHGTSRTTRNVKTYHSLIYYHPTRRRARGVNAKDTPASQVL